MGIWQGRSKRKKTGGRLRPIRNKRRFEIGRELQFPIVGEKSLKLYRVRGAARKVRILGDNQVNVFDPTSKTTKSVRTTSVVRNDANPNYVQRNIISRGAVVQTELGLVQIRSRPGQDGVLNGVLLPKQASEKTPNA